MLLSVTLRVHHGDGLRPFQTVSDALDVGSLVIEMQRG